MAEMPDRPREGGGGTAEVTDSERQARPAQSEAPGDEAPKLMEEVLRRENLIAAHARVVSNGGAPGMDGMTVETLESYCREHWPRIREELLSSKYQPQPVRRVEIPKPGGGVRMLGVPTVLDRMIQQALLQVLTPIFDPTFSADSYGFRPGRSAHQAVERAREHIAAGQRWVVDLDLAKFFDTVNHDVLMHRVGQRVRDKRVLQLIGRDLRAGMLEGGLVSPRTEGTPQGGPLSPLLSNILLNDLDQELGRRGHRFVRYADDCNVYVQSQRAGERVMASLERFLTKGLRLKVNRDQSAVARPWNRGFLGYRVTVDRKPKLKVAPASIARRKQEAACQAAHWARPEPRPHHRGDRPAVARVDRLLSTRGDKRESRTTGSVGPAETARHSVAAVEAGTHPVREASRPGHRLRTCSPQRRQWPRPVVERGRESYEPGRSDRVAAQPGTRVPSR